MDAIARRTLAGVSVPDTPLVGRAIEHARRRRDSQDRRRISGSSDEATDDVAFVTSPR